MMTVATSSPTMRGLTLNALGVEGLRLAHEESREVEQVHGDVGDDHSLAVEQPGLRRVAVVEATEAEAPEERPSDRSRIEHLLHPAHRVLEAEVLMHHERKVLGGHGRDHRASIGQVPGEGLLADGGYAVLRGQEHHLRVRRGSGGNVDEVELLVGEELGGIGVRSPAEVARRCGQALGVGVAHGHQFDVGDLGPGVQMVLGEEAGADDGEAIGRAHSSVGLRGSVIHSLHDPTYIREPGRPATVMASTFCAAVMPEPQ